MNQYYFYRGNFVIMRFNCLLSLLLTILSFSVSAQDPLPGLMPQPASVTRGVGKFFVTSAFDITCQAGNTDTIVFDAANRFYHALMRNSGVVMKAKTISAVRKVPDAQMRIGARESKGFTLGMDESYTLQITGNGISLDAPNSIGVLRGLTTLQQLIQKDSSGFFFPAVTIRDAPAYPWRGLMIDVSRHFIPLEVLRRNIDAMAAVKLNVLHLHLTDDEGFRIESKQYPGLHLKGSDGLFYTQNQMKELITYAKLRGILIIPEFDMPGHTKSWFAGYPELASSPGPYTPGPRFDLGATTGGTINLAAIMTAPTPTIDPTKESTWVFLEKFFKEMALLFPSPYIHIGADENNGVAWKNNKEISAFMSSKGYKSPADLQAYFVSRLYQIIGKAGKKMIGWEELYHPGIPKDIVVQKWIPESPLMQSHGKTEDIAAGGNGVIMSQGFYLDLFMPAYIHYNNPAMPKNKLPNFLGGEAAIWTEIADAENIERRVWPRAGVIAERLWSPAASPDIRDMYNRMFRLSRQLDEAGLQHLTSYDRQVRRLVVKNETAALKILMDLLSPLRGYRNLFARIKDPAALLNNQAPLVGVGDWVSSDSEARIEFRNLVEDFLRNKDGLTAEKIRAQLNTWKNNHDLLSGSIDHSLYKELSVHSRNLKTLSEIGLNAVTRILSGTQFNSDELASFQKLFKEAAVASGTTTLAIVPEIESLVNQKLTSEPAQFPLF